jgi:hypothetical protein
VWNALVLAVSLLSASVRSQQTRHCQLHNRLKYSSGPPEQPVTINISSIQLELEKLGMVLDTAADYSLKDKIAVVTGGGSGKAPLSLFI